MDGRSQSTSSSTSYSESPARSSSPGTSSFGEDRYIEYIAGDLPLILSAPHGGRETPEEIPDRVKGVLQADANTQEVARAVAAEITARTGHHAHLIICRLARRKLPLDRLVDPKLRLGNRCRGGGWPGGGAVLRPRMGGAGGGEGEEERREGVGDAAVGAWDLH